jgi:hypothetical protein
MSGVGVRGSWQVLFIRVRVLLIIPWSFSCHFRLTLFSTLFLLAAFLRGAGVTSRRYPLRYSALLCSWVHRILLSRLTILSCDICVWFGISLWCGQPRRLRCRALTRPHILLSLAACAWGSVLGVGRLRSRVGTDCGRTEGHALHGGGVNCLTLFGRRLGGAFSLFLILGRTHFSKCCALSLRGH